MPSACTQLKRASCIPMANVGREAHAYLTHITTRYDKLATKTVFAQGFAPGVGWVPHHGGGHLVAGSDFFYDYLSPTTPSRLAISLAVEQLSEDLSLHETANYGSPADMSAGPDPTVMPASCPARSEWRRPRTIKPYWDARQPKQSPNLSHFWNTYLAKELGPRPSPQMFANGAIFSASKGQIGAHPKAFYESLIAPLEAGSHNQPASAFYLEAAWAYMLGDAAAVRDCAKETGWFGPDAAVEGAHVGTASSQPVGRFTPPSRLPSEDVLENA